MRRILVASLMTLSMFSWGAEATKVDYVPKVGGSFRARWELATETGENRFQVKNARIDVSGYAAAWADYYISVDLCDRGKIKFLDAWARVTPVRGLAFQAGQFRMPLGFDPHRGPHNYFFANRSFLAKQVCNYRAVGIKAIYDFAMFPLKLEAGVFNPTTIGDHTGWNRQMNYSGKATLGLPAGFSATAGIMSICPDSVRTNMVDGGIAWHIGRWTVEGEYIYKHYTHRAHPACHSFVTFADYAFPLNAGILNRGSLQARFDGMTGNSDSKRDSDGKLVTNDPRRNRITVGATVGNHLNGGRFVDFRINYEHYFYSRGVEAPDLDNASKLVAELVVRF